MDCPCPVCTNRVLFQDITTHSSERFIQEKAPETIYDRLAEISSELEAYGAPNNFINELNDLCDQIDLINDQVHQLQIDCIKRPIDITQFKLGEISRRLF